MKKALSVFMFVLLLVSMLMLSFDLQSVKASGAIYIRADGSIDPLTAPIYQDGDYYTLTGDITSDTDGIIVQRNNIVIDGKGCLLHGASYRGNGFTLTNVNNVTIKNTSIQLFDRGIDLASSYEIRIYDNNLVENWGNIYLDGSSFNDIQGNMIESSMSGINVQLSSNNRISGNNMTFGGVGITLAYSPNNDVSGNNITGYSAAGIASSSSDNSIIGNNIANNGNGIQLQECSYNMIFHNNFIGNGNNAYSYPDCFNVWDDGYPSGGNCWSDYNSIDLYSGPFQNETGSDNIADSPYVIDANNQDNYPLMRTYVPFENQTIYIRADGSVDPSGAPIGRMGDIYTLTGDISSAAWGIVVERDNMTLEGAGYTLEGGGNGVGVSLSGRSNVTIENATIKSFEYGIYLWNSSYSRVSENNITENGWGMMIYPYSCHSIVTRNNITHNSGDGIRTGDLSDNTTISYNYIAENLEGIYVGRSSNDTIVYNRIAANIQIGIRVDWSSHIDILQNNMTGSYDAISIWNTTNCQVLENSVKGSGCGLSIEYASAINITQNDVSENAGGVRFVNSTDSSVVNNNFINNTLQAYTINSTVTWNSGYPSGGNCWSDYPGRDVFRGAFQNETGSDGIGDTVYEVDLANWDNYPLMKPYPWDDHGVGVTYVGRVYAFDVVVPLKTVVGLNYSMSVDTFVMNYGASAEVFNVTVYANESIIGTFENVALAAGNSTILSLRWDTAGLAYGNYTISAVASNVSGEFDLTDNIKTNGVVYVGIPGDVNGDGKVDVKDIAYVARRFGIGFRDSLWNPNADLNDDGKIDVMDVAAAARQFGKHYP
ncbi:right-handed parallel beta-helix repeat-containing protein [Candidatus Bathyarchaeota archaeon]|nr:right-handed parallel beta-helix repeat-containing protein [Candidatus Bathyarchaeota archaeon]